MTASDSVQVPIPEFFEWPVENGLCNFAGIWPDGDFKFRFVAKHVSGVSTHLPYDRESKSWSVSFVKQFDVIQFANSRSNSRYAVVTKFKGGNLRMAVYEDAGAARWNADWARNLAVGA